MLKKKLNKGLSSLYNIGADFMRARANLPGSTWEWYQPSVVYWLEPRSWYQSDIPERKKKSKSHMTAHRNSLAEFGDVIPLASG